MTEKEIELVDKDLQENDLWTEENKNAIRNGIFHQHFSLAIHKLKILHLLTQHSLDIIFSLNKEIHPIKFVNIFNREELIKLLTLEDIESINRLRCDKIEEVLEAFKNLKKVGDLIEDNIKIISNHPKPLHIAAAFKTLKEADLLTEVNIKIIREHLNPENISNAFKTLKEADLLTKDNIKIIREHLNPENISNAFKTLKEADLLTEDNIKIIREHPQPWDMSSAFKTLKKADLLTEDNIKIIHKYPKPSIVASAFEHLKEADLLTEDNIKIICEHLNPAHIAYAFKTLKEADLLTEDNIKIIREHPKPVDIYDAFKILKESDLLTEDNIKIICDHPYPFLISSAFKTVKETNSLTPDNIKIIRNYQQPSAMVGAFKKLMECNLLTRDNIQSLLNNPDILLPLRLRMDFNRYPRYAGNTVFSILPNHFITQEVFDHLIQICHVDEVHNINVQIALERYIEQLLFRATRDRGDHPLNNSQSTHTASVHQSASASAKKLSEHYQYQLKNNEDQVILEIEKYINNLGGSLKEKSAKTYIKKVIQGILEFTDPSSGVTLKKLIMLFHLAIHDTNKCMVDKADGQKVLVNALYEIQRGYNLSEMGVDDNNEKDIPICISGAFNKLIELLSTIYPDCQLIFINPATAALKLPIIVKEEALSYLKNNDLEVINEETWVKVIWPKIKKIVAQCLFSEFSGLYAKGEEDKKFIDLVDSGVHIDINQLTEGMAKFSDSSQHAIIGSDVNKKLSVVNQPSNNLNGGYHR